MDEIYTHARPCDHVDESTRLLGFRLMLKEDAGAFRSESEMEKSS